MEDIRSGFKCHLYWLQQARHQSLGLLHTLVTGILTPLLLRLVKGPGACVSTAQNLSPQENLEHSEIKVENERQPR